MTTKNAFCYMPMTSVARRTQQRCLLFVALVFISICLVFPARAEEDGVAKELKSTTSYIVDGVSLEMVFCPAGSFIMGSPISEQGRLSDYETQHRVTLTKPFLIGKYEVTQKQYDAVTGRNPSCFRSDNRPVENVSWHNAMEFCEELNVLTEGKRPAGYKFSLPTEAQWEYACRAGTTTGLNNGRDLRHMHGEDIILNKLGWYDENSNRKTHPVGQKQPNAWGIYDMHGNVWEWCLDWYSINKSNSDDAVDPVRIDTPPFEWSRLFVGPGRMLRGGSWYDNAVHCRSAFRWRDASPDYYQNQIGFRIVLVSEK